MDASLDKYNDLKLKLSGFVPAGAAFKRNMLLDVLYASLPRDPQAKVQIYNAEILPGGFTNWHQHNGPAFFVALQGLFEAHFPGRRPDQGQGRRVLCRADRQISPRPQPAPGIAISLHRHRADRARSRARDEFGRVPLVAIYSAARGVPANLTPRASTPNQASSATATATTPATTASARA